MAETKKKTSVKTKSPGRKKNYVWSVGRRKRASARVRLYHGKGEILVNQLSIQEYFPGEVARITYEKPFLVTSTLGKYYATVKVVGSGKAAQLGAVVHGLARALDKENQTLFHLPLKKAGLLTRDDRRKERSKPGQMGKARKQKQSPKR